MASTKTKSASTSGAGKKPKAAVTSSTTGSSSPVLSTASEAVTYGSGRPDKKIYDAEQQKIQVDIDAVQGAVREKLNLTTRGGPGNDRRNELRAELDQIRGQQSSNKLARGKVFDQLNALQEGVQKKIKDLNVARSKILYKTVADVDERIKQLDKQVESGNLKIADEKRALAEISQLKRNRRTVEGFQAEQDGIEKDRATADELKKQLDDPEARAISERYEAIKGELDELKKEGDEAYANRSKLMDERSALQAQLDTLYGQKRESAQRFREANDRHWAKVTEDRARREERHRAQRIAEAEAKKKELVDRLREDASVPAFQAQIEDCQTLIDYFSGKTSTPAALSTTSHEKTELVGVPKLELRKVEAQEGLVVRKKKGEEEEAYFVGGGKGKKNKKGGSKPVSASNSNSSEAPSGQLNIPLPTLSALLSLSIPPPTSTADLPRVVEDLKTKKAWFEANQERVTAENKEKAEAEIRRLTGGDKQDIVSPEEIKPPNGVPEWPTEPAPTPASTLISPIAVPSEEEVEEKLESVAEDDVEEKKDE
ncbi:unnamed protein product [Somion occarium]|uniref:Nuclear segregation protein Bfr1 n=1 Tax=Somion occarium TaxID=3059160 RepID=A0ABP1D0T3_9APHY